MRKYCKRDIKKPMRLPTQPKLAPEIAQWVQSILGVTPGVTEIWLIGSRANDTFNPDSDWDFLAFANLSVLESLKVQTSIHRPDIDFLVLTDGENFQSAWGKLKTGSLTRWNWCKVTDDFAHYLGSKWIPEQGDTYEDAPFDMSSLGKAETSTCRAFKISKQDITD